MLKYTVLNNYKGVTVVPVFEKKGLGGLAKELDKKLNGLLSEMYNADDFGAKKMQMSFSRTQNKEVPVVLLVGLGEENNLDIRGWKQAVGSIVIAMQSKKIKDFSLLLNNSIVKKFGVKKLGLETVVAVEVANYAFDEHKSEKEARVESLKEVILAGDFSTTDKNNLQKGIKEGILIGESVNYTRRLGNTPPSIMTPSLLAIEAQKLAKNHAPQGRTARGSKLKVKVLSRPEMKKIGIGCLLGVSQGSAKEPKFIILEYYGLPRGETLRGGAKSMKPTVLIGKGMTFDSGGWGIKPGNSMNDMKFDMLGAATVLGVLKAAVELGLKKNIVGLIPACENMPSGTAYRPDDILTAYDGRTVEIGHTDAEGRLILADALGYACEYKPKEVIDFATLTGACMVALGNERSGLFGNDERIIEKLKNKSEEAGEQLWHLPLGEEYNEAIKSEVADIKNIGGVDKPGFGGASTAAAFLQFFTDYPWAHIDLSCSYYGGKGKPWIRGGANGFGVQTMINYLR